MKRDTRLLLQKVSVFFLVPLLYWIFSPVATAGTSDKGYYKTLEAFRQVACQDEELFNYNKDLIRVLNYTNMRALRSFVQLECISAQEIVDTLKRLVTAKISFTNQLLLEHFVTLEGADVEMSWQFLGKLENLTYSASRVMTAFEFVDVITARDLLDYVDRIEGMDEPAGWALKAFLVLPGQSKERVAQGMDMLEAMSEKQQWATEQCCQVPEMNAYNALENMAFIRRLPNTDAWNARGLFKQDVAPEVALAWLRDYFSLPQQGQEELFFRFSAADKAILLKGFAAASDYLTWKINDLHSVTDLRGQEISSGVLSSYSTSFLDRIWKRLDGKVREQYGKSFYQALHSGKKGAAIATLREATGRARVQAAHDTTSANIYILLSKGSELYDSSFRDVLVPVLQSRINDRFNSNLLQFLLAVDPENNHVSDFIISLAQRGKLSIFFPEDSEEQKRVLDLVTTSAFQDENSLILFSATFMKLLENIEPETRSYLIGKMLTAIRDENTVFTTQLRVILQYYQQYYSDFVGDVDKSRINLMMFDYGAIPLELYTRTAFTEWKADGRLSSLSVFHNDDDGKESFLSNCAFLVKQGYQPRLSRGFDLHANSAATAEAASLLRNFPTSPSNTMRSLFVLQSRKPVIIDWVKSVNGVEISHSVFIFQGEAVQMELLKQFLKGGHEMFAQRGHSYWRKEQLIEPISKLVESGAVTEQDLLAKQRFMSLGSCGGIRAYSELATTFKNNVDILATVGTGKAVINNPYNEFLFEAVAEAKGDLTWDDVASRSAQIFTQGLGEDYLQPGSLPAILHKIMDQKTIDHAFD
ncbi:MAG: hypothetical protein KKD01_09525 [Proteobacteria bacterium]|nr:hypothetical protein [Pseudomonadota bacterium]MBU1454950.1 hypothetical protein [Pseudomonadota bacterium]